MNRRIVPELEVLGNLGLHKPNYEVAQISNFDAAEWAIEAGSGTGTITDTGNELKISPDAGQILNVSKAVALSLYKRTLELDVKITDYANLSYGHVYIYDGDGVSQYWSNCIQGTWTGLNNTDEYHRIQLHLGNLSGAGVGIDLRNIVKIVLVVKCSASLGSVYVRNLGYAENNPVGYVHLSCDDTYDTVLPEGIPRLAEYGFPVTFFVEIEALGTAGHLTLEQIKKIYEAGHEIGSHTVTHPYLSTESLQVAMNEFRQSKLHLEREGIPCDSIAMPFNRCSARNLVEAQRIYSTVFSQANRAMTPTGTGEWYRQGIDGNTVFATDIQPLIDSVKLHGGVISIFWHGIGTADSTEVTPTVFQEMLDYIYDQGITCITANAMRRMAPLDIQRGTPQGPSIKTITAASGTLLPSDSGVLLCDTSVSGAMARTLPAASDGDWEFDIYALGSYLVTITKNVADTMNGRTTFTIYPGTHQKFTSDRLITVHLSDGLFEITSGLIARKYQQIPLSGWTAPAAVGSGAGTLDARYNQVKTGVTANSAFRHHYGLMGFSTSAAAAWISYNERLILQFLYARTGSDAEAVARFQIKLATTEGALGAKGIGIRADNLTVYSESYGTVLGSSSLGSALASDVLRPYRIIVYPGVKIEWYSAGQLRYSETDTTKIPSGGVGANLVHSIINGATGTVDAKSTIQQLEVWKELI